MTPGVERHAQRAKERRDANRFDGRCINDTLGRTHGPCVDDGVRCAACRDVHRGSRGPR